MRSRIDAPLASLLGLFGACLWAAGAPALALASAVEGEAWTVRVDGPAAATAPGTSGQVEVRLAARGGYHVNADYPMSFRPGPGSTAAVQGARVALSPTSRSACDGHPADTCAVTVVIPFTGPRAGEARLAGTFAFSVCTAERCLIEKVPIDVRLDRPGGEAKASAR